MQRRTISLVAAFAACLLIVSVIQVNALRLSASEAPRPAYTLAEPSYPVAGTGIDASPDENGQQQTLRRDLSASNFHVLPATRQHLVPKPTTIFGPDDRRQLSPTFAPVSWLILWDATPALIAQCSGTFIGPNVVLTAAHCVYNTAFGGWITAVDVGPGNDGDDSPNGWELASNAWVPQDWIDGQGSGLPNWEWDYAIVTLESPALGNAVGWVEMASLTTEALQSGSLNPTTIGYPGDKPSGTQWATGQSSLKNVMDAFLVNELDAYPGQSGSGMFRGADGKLVGIVSAESPSFNLANRVRSLMIADLNGACANLDCWFAYSEETGPETTPTPQPPPPTATPTEPPPPPPVDPFERTWQRTDRPVAEGAARRTWMWGPDAITVHLLEDYAESPDGERVVLYYDKSRMEITDPGGDANSIWYVTNGLLVKELITGQMQSGDNEFIPLNPAAINVAGDPDDDEGPTYVTFLALLDDAPLADGATITQRVNRGGDVADDPRLAGHGVTAAYLVDVLGLKHQIASPFWALMNASGTVYENGTTVNDTLFEDPFYATGYPISEAYWATVKLGGQARDVLMQCFERSCLTFTPGNAPEWQVEAGNVGQHYFRWKYGTTP